MSLTVDVNVLLYASNEAAPEHAAARSTIERLCEGPELVYLFWPTLVGYLRIVTHPAILPSPLSPREAEQNVSALLGRPHIRTGSEGQAFWHTYRSMTADLHPRGNLVSDSQLAALMIEHGVSTILTRDSDFRRFDGIRVVDPFS